MKFELLVTFSNMKNIDYDIVNEKETAEQPIFAGKYTFFNEMKIHFEYKIKQVQIHITILFKTIW